MTDRTPLKGKYRIINETLLRDKAIRSDPRKPFYEAMLSTRSYGGYLAEVGEMVVEVKSLKRPLLNGRDEILYCRRNGWIADT